MIQLKWLTCGTDKHWCSLETLDVAGANESGVYVIWHEGKPGKVVYVGQGAPVSKRLASHKNDARIQAYAKVGKLRVTWASVPAAQRDGVERYLADKWSPLVGDAHPDVTGIAVNSPW